jgi:hypothetical protein
MCSNLIVLLFIIISLIRLTIGGGLVWIYFTIIHTARNYKLLECYSVSPQITTATSKPFSACCLFTSRSFVTAYNSGDSSASSLKSSLNGGSPSTAFLPQTPLQNSLGWIESEIYVTTDGQSASLSWNKAPIRGLRPYFYYCQTVAGLLLWSALSDERTGLSFTIAAGTRQRRHSRVCVPWDSRPYFTVSDSRLPFSSPPTTRRATVEVFDPSSTRESWLPKLASL